MKKNELQTKSTRPQGQEEKMKREEFRKLYQEWEKEVSELPLMKAAKAGTATTTPQEIMNEQVVWLESKLILSPLAGSEKQITWATDLRQKFLDSLLRGLTTAFDHLWYDSVCGPPEERDFEKWRIKFELIRDLGQITSAKLWIESRSCSPTVSPEIIRGRFGLDQTEQKGERK